MRLLIPRLTVFLLLLSSHVTVAQTATDWSLTIKGETESDSITLTWLKQQLGPEWKVKELRAHLDHVHLEYTWKKLGVSVQVNEPGGFVNGIAIDRTKRKVKSRDKRAIRIGLVTGILLLDEQIFRYNLQQAGWSAISLSPGKEADNPKAAIRCTLKGESFSLHAAFASGRRMAERVTITFLHD